MKFFDKARVSFFLARCVLAFDLLYKKNGWSLHEEFDRLDWGSTLSSGKGNPGWHTCLCSLLVIYFLSRISCRNNLSHAMPFSAHTLACSLSQPPQNLLINSLKMGVGVSRSIIMCPATSTTASLASAPDRCMMMTWPTFGFYLAKILYIFSLQKV